MSVLLLPYYESDVTITNI